MKNHYAKFEYKRMKTAGVIYCINQTPLRISDRKKFYVQHPSKMRKYLSNVHKIGGAHLQCVNNHYAKIENKEIKTVGVTDYTNQTSYKHFCTEKCLSSTPLKTKKIFMKCALNRRCTFSICEQSLCKV